ncbi:MAG: PTS sugar transporter subunit IIA [Candidatus Delongbacteria bacterium]|nr:PTS sugar transporter subunit IIA [Candidatus Delongbacteria bacterium]
MILSDLIKDNNVIFLDVKNSNSAIEELVNKTRELKLVNNDDEFLNAVLERENIISTGIGLGIAIPHSKLQSIENFFVIVGILKNEIEWNSIDSKPVKVVFLIGGPSNAQKKYLGLLSKLMLLIKSSTIREKLFTAKSQNDITDIFTSF